MIKVGIIDLYMDNWHTNFYPGYLRQAAGEAGKDIDVVYAYAQGPSPSGDTTAQWCLRTGGIQEIGSYDEIIEKSDALMVMCADDVYPHERLAEKALRSGKRVFCDKTFAPDVASATRMFDLAETHGTQLFSCSAQRYCPDLNTYMEAARAAGKPAAYAATTGPGEIINYSVHQLEMIQRAMGCGARDCMAFPVHSSETIVYRYDDGRRATFVQSPNAVFTMVVSDDVSHWHADNKPTNRAIAIGDFYIPFMHRLIDFFCGGNLPVSRQDTLEIVAMQQAGREAMVAPETWVPVPDYR